MSNRKWKIDNIKLIPKNATAFRKRNLKKYMLQKECFINLLYNCEMQGKKFKYYAGLAIQHNMTFFQVMIIISSFQVIYNLNSLFKKIFKQIKLRCEVEPLTYYIVHCNIYYLSF